MEGFIEFIFANLFIIVFIVISLLSFVNKLLQNQTQKSQQKRQQSVPEKGTLSDTFKKFQDMIESFEEEVETVFTGDTDPNAKKISDRIEKKTPLAPATQMEPREEQLGSLNEPIVPIDSTERTQMIEPLATLSQTKATEPVRHVSAVDMEKMFTEQGLVASIIMAEVLGPPRARKPYHGISQTRNDLTR